MTKRLYYENSYLLEFEATIVEHLEVKEKPAVVLDRTAFYPTSGGQPCDTGALAERVSRVPKRMSQEESFTFSTRGPRAMA